jgi:Tfp pilus assembly protein PilZ
MGQEQRSEKRAEVEAIFAARDESGAGTLVFASADVSAGGAFLKSELLLEVGETLALEFQVPGGTVVKTPARVAWVRRFPEGSQAAGMGVQFTSLGEHERAVLQHWLG